MSEIKLLLMEKLAAKETPADTDTMIVAEGNVLKKSTISQLITFLKEKLGVNAINTKLNDYVLAKAFSKTITLSNGYAVASFDTALEGYTAIGIIECSFSTTWIAVAGMSIYNGKANITARHISNASATGDINCYATVLYVKNS